MSPLRSRFLLRTAFGLAIALTTWNAVVFADDTALSLRVDPTFSRSKPH